MDKADKAPVAQIVGGFALLGLLIYGVKLATSVGGQTARERITAREIHRTEDRGTIRIPRRTNKQEASLWARERGTSGIRRTFFNGFAA